MTQELFVRALEGGVEGMNNMLLRLGGLGGEAPQRRAKRAATIGLTSPSGGVKKPLTPPEFSLGG